MSFTVKDLGEVIDSVEFEAVEDYRKRVISVLNKVEQYAGGVKDTSRAIGYVLACDMIREELEL